MEAVMIEQLKKIVLEKDLINKSKEYFWGAFNNWRQDQPKKYAERFKDINDEDINLFVHSIGLKSSEWPNCDYNHITVTLYILSDMDLRKSETLGYYDTFFLLDGEIDDDILKI